jgi:hypothetical protein
MRWLVLIYLLFPASASADEWTELSAAWPSADQVVTSRTVTFDFDEEGDLLVTDVERRVVLRDAAREDLAKWEVYDRPGCREIVEVSVEVTSRDGTVRTDTGDELVWGPQGDHPTNPERASRDGVLPRPGLTPGAAVVDREVVRYPASCYGGLIATSRTLAPLSVPVLHEEVTVDCASAPCFAAVEGGGEVEETETGFQFTQTNIAARVVEPADPDGGDRRREVWVSSSGDRMAAAKILRPALAVEAKRWGRRAGAYLSAAKTACPGYDDPVDRVACYLGDHQEVAGDGDFWGQGFDWGTETAAAGTRHLLPLEWWAVGWALLEKHGATPVLLDDESHRPPPDIGAVTRWDQVGFLLPGKGLLHLGSWEKEIGGAIPSLAGNHMLLMTGAETSVQAVESAPGAHHEDWVGTVSYDSEGKVTFQYAITWTNARGVELRQLALDIIDNHEEWAKKRKRRGRKVSKLGSRIETEWAKKRLGHLIGRPLTRGYIKRPKDDDGGSASGLVRFKGEDLSDEREDFVMLRLPLLIPAYLETLGGRAERVTDFALQSLRRTYTLDIAAPRGFVLTALPPSLSVQEGPVRVHADFARGEAGAVTLKATIEVDGPIAPAGEAAAIADAADLLHRLGQVRLLYAAEPPAP